MEQHLEGGSNEAPRWGGISQEAGGAPPWVRGVTLDLLNFIILAIFILQTERPRHREGYTAGP